MRAHVLLTLAIVCSGADARAPARYQDGWDVHNFYVAVQSCRRSIYAQGAARYANDKIAQARATGADVDALQPELHRSVIRSARLTDRDASTSCFCVVNEAAKTVTQAAFTLQMLGPLFEGEQCAAVVDAASAGSASSEDIEALILR